MSDESYIGSIVLFAGPFAPRGWAYCQGQLLNIQQNSAVFAVLGTAYGGDGVTTFALPDLRGRVPVGTGPGVGGAPTIALAQQGGETNHTLAVAEMPPHNHIVNGDATTGSQLSPSGGNLAQGATAVRTGSTGVNGYTTGTPAAPAQLNPATLSQTGGGQPHNNMQPYLGLNYIICLQGIFPSRN